MKRLDLRKEFAEVYAFVVGRAKAFNLIANPGPGKGKRVSRIDVGFGLYQSGWMCVVFDTRRSPEPDGEWNEYIEDTVMGAAQVGQGLRRSGVWIAYTGPARWHPPRTCSGRDRRAGSRSGRHAAGGAAQSSG